MTAQYPPDGSLSELLGIMAAQLVEADEDLWYVDSALHGVAERPVTAKSLTGAVDSLKDHLDRTWRCLVQVEDHLNPLRATAAD
jgi:hypothetical protein